MSIPFLVNLQRLIYPRNEEREARCSFERKKIKTKTREMQQIVIVSIIL